MVPVDSTRGELKYLVERQREEIRTINEVGKLLHSTTDPQQLVRLVASYLKETFPLALCAVLVIERRKLHIIQFAKISKVDISTAIQQIYGRVGKSPSQPLEEASFTSTVEDRSASSGQWAQASAGYLRSSYFTPLMFNGKPVGLLAVFSGKAEAFAKEDQHVINIVADQLTAALRNAFLLEELLQADQMKNDLLALLSHELRIPLTAVREGVSLILEGVLGPTTSEQVDFLQTVQRNADRLGGLIEEVEAATRLITGTLKYTLEKIDLSVMLKELKEKFHPAAQAKGISLQAADSTRPVFCVGDAKQLKQALCQLLENGIWATPSGGQVTVSVSEMPNGVEIQVIDTGKGIPTEDLPHLFEQFHSVGGINDRKTGGLGLGLFMAKRIVDAHHGTIQLKSQVGHGTQVTVRLPKNQEAS